MCPDMTTPVSAPVPEAPQPPEAPPGGAVIPVAPEGDPTAFPAAPISSEFGPGVTPPTYVTTVPAPTQGNTTTAPMRELMQDPNVVAAVEQARREEREKLHNRLEAQQEEINRLKPLAEYVAGEQERRTAEEQAAHEEQEAARRAKMSAEELIAEERAAMQAERESWRQEQQRITATLEAEQRFQQLEAFRSRRIAEETNDIAPQFLDYIVGNSEDEIEAAITLAKTKTASIVQEVAAAGIAQRQTMRGVSPTGAPPAGPMDTSTGYQTLTADEIRGMDHATYQKNRGALLEAARRSGPYGQG